MSNIAPDVGQIQNQIVFIHEKRKALLETGATSFGETENHFFSFFVSCCASSVTSSVFFPFLSNCRLK